MKQIFRIYLIRRNGYDDYILPINRKWKESWNDCYAQTVVLICSCNDLLPMVFGIKAVWFTQPLVDFIMITVGILMMLSELNKMGKDKA